jgi:uncharacterized membrane protein (DUF485 family)
MAIIRRPGNNNVNSSKVDPEFHTLLSQSGSYSLDLESENEESDDIAGDFNYPLVAELERTQEIDNEQTLQEVAEQTTYGAVFLNDLIRRQRALSISVAITFLIIILSLPLLNFWLRDLVSFELFGFPVSWLFLGILIYPLIWLLAFYFVSTADKYEEEFTNLVE